MGNKKCSIFRFFSRAKTISSIMLYKIVKSVKNEIEEIVRPLFLVLKPEKNQVETFFLPIMDYRARV
jgi:hypothetical protein